MWAAQLEAGSSPPVATAWPIHASAATAEAPGDRLARRLVVAGGVLASLSFSVTLAVGAVEGLVLPYERLEPDAEISAFDWASTGLTLVAAYTCGVHALVAAESRRSFVVLAVVLTYFSLDDEFVVHESVGTWVSDWLGLERIGVAVWTAIYAPVLLAAAALLWRAARRAPVEARWLLAGGLTCLGAGVLLEGLVRLVDAGPELASKVHASSAVVEEAFELAGWSLIAVGVAVVLVGTVRSSAGARGGRE